jgi:hypothetical protein
MTIWRGFKALELQQSHIMTQRLMPLLSKCLSKVLARIMDSLSLCHTSCSIEIWEGLCFCGVERCVSFVVHLMDQQPSNYRSICCVSRPTSLTSEKSKEPRHSHLNISLSRSMSRLREGGMPCPKVRIISMPRPEKRQVHGSRERNSGSIVGVM